MPAIRIRPEEPRDHERVFEIQQAAFGGPAEARLVGALRASAQPQISLVAETDAGELVGHIFFSPVRVVSSPVNDDLSPIEVSPANVDRRPVEVDGKGRREPMGLGPVGVDPAGQQRGVGSALCRAGLDACLRIGAPFVVVLGHPTYYPRFGFAPARPRGLFYKNEQFDRAFFVIELAPGALDGFAGEVVYRPEFDAV